MQGHLVRALTTTPDIMVEFLRAGLSAACGTVSLSEPEAGHIVSSTHTWSHCLSQKLVTLSEPEAGQDFFDVLRKPRNELPLLMVEPVAMFLPSQLC